jgi:hypothetical protein
MISKYIAYNLFHKQNHHHHFSVLKKIGHHNYELTYNIKGKIYKIILYQVKGPMNIMKVENSNEEDVTDSILTYYGVGRDFHGCSYKPTDLGFKSLKFYMSDDRILKFSENEIIQL